MYHGRCPSSPDQGAIIWPLSMIAQARPSALTRNGCGESPQDRAAARANEDEQQLLQKKIQQGLTKPPATRAKRR